MIDAALSRRARWRLSGAALLLALAQAAAAQGNPKASRLYEDALARYQQRDLAGAIVQLKNALQIDRQNISAQVLLGKALLDSGDANQAGVAFEEAMRQGVSRAEVVVPLAKVFVAQGRQQELLADPRFVPSELPPRVQYDLLLLRAAARTDLLDPAAGLKEIQQARALQPGDPGSWMAEVPLRIRARQLTEAQAAAQKALELAPRLADAHYARAEVAHVRGDVPGALAAYGRALELDPAHPASLVSRASLLLDLGRDAEARRDVDALLKGGTKDPRGLYLRAMLAERAGQTAQERAALNEVTALLDLLPASFLRFRPQTAMLGGLAHYGLGEREKARPYLELVLRAEPSHPVGKLLANIYLEMKNNDRAVDVLENYLRGAPNDMQALLLLASAQMALGRHARAAQMMEEALRQQGDQPPLRAALGLSLVGVGRFEDAARELESVLRKDPTQLQAGTALASMHIQAGRADDAVRVTQVLLKPYPANPGVQHLAGLARRLKGDTAGARTAFAESARLDPAFVAPQIELARLEADAGAFPAAQQRLQKLLAANDKQVEALLAMGLLAERMGRVDEAQRWLEKADDNAGAKNVDPALQLVDFHLRQRHLEQARDALKRATNRQPDSGIVLFVLARVQLASGDPASARNTLKRATTVVSFNPPVLVQIAQLQLEAGDVGGASFSLDRALEVRPDYLQALGLRAEVDLREGDLARAEQRAKQIVTRYPRAGVGPALLGEVATARGQRDAAVEQYRRAHELDASSTSALHLFAAMHRRDRAAALQFSEQWLRQHPGDTVMMRAVADSRLRAGELPQARTSYDALLKLSPKDSEALNNLAYTLVRLQDPTALSVAERALALNPNAAHIVGTTGWAAFNAGQPDRALQLLREARLRDPNNPDTRYFLAAVLASQTRRAEAREELSAALAMSRAFPHQKDAQALLQTLK